MPRLPRHPEVITTTYSSKEVKIPGHFLREDPYDAQPIQIEHINFKDSNLSEYDGHYAVVLDNVLSPSECAELLKLAEASAEGQNWRPAMVNVGYGREIVDTTYRNSDRIVWDSSDIAKRIWDRCKEAPGVSKELGSIQGNAAVQGPSAAAGRAKWKMTRLNERMRFLRYGPGHFFQQHCDGQFAVPGHPKFEKSYYTLHLYLSGNDGTVGGQTRFFSRFGDRCIDVVPAVGRVLIFQQRNLVHSGEEVSKGLKYTMRTDILYELDDTREAA